MMDGRRSHRATQYGDLPGSVARVFAGGDGGHGRREREAGRGGESLGGSSEAQRVGIPPSPEELAEVVSGLRWRRRRRGDGPLSGAF